MFTRQHADEVVASYLKETEAAMNYFGSALPGHKERPRHTLVVVRVDEHEFGCLYFYDSAAHIKSGDIGAALVGNAPLIVDRVAGKLYVTGTAYPIEHYLQEYRGSRTNA